MSIEAAGQARAVPAFFLPEAFDNAVANDIAALHVTVGGLHQLDHLMRREVRRGLPTRPEKLALVMYRTVPSAGTPYRHFYELDPGEPLVSANQLGMGGDSAHITTSKAEILALRRTILEVQVADFVAGTLSGRLVWAALNESPEIAHSNPRHGLQRFAANWSNSVSQALFGPTQGRKQETAESAARQYPEAIYLQRSRGRRLG